MPIQFFVLMLCCFRGNTQTNIDTLLKNFIAPPEFAKPLVWWHWMNGNIAKAGIAKDLAWMKRAGVGGFQAFDIGLPTPNIVGKQFKYMSPEWKDAFGFATKLADSLKLKIGIVSGPGWSESAGPWVSPKDGMKKLVWSETYAEGGLPFTGRLPALPSASGIFQNWPRPWGFVVGGTKPPPEYSRDVLIIAYRLPDNDIPFRQLKPTVMSSAGNFSLDQLTDGDIATASLLPSDTVRGYSWIQFSFKRPQTFKSITIVGGGDKGPFGSYGVLNKNRTLEVSDDGQHFRRVCDIPAGGVPQQTIAIPVTTSRFFRITFKNPVQLPDYGAIYGIGGEVPKAPLGTNIAEIVFHTALRVHRFEEKAGFGIATDLYEQATPASSDTIAVTEVIDLTAKMRPDGTLNWTPPSGNWNIVRFGYSLVGRQSYPARPEATGLEVDKFDPAAIKNYFENYIDQYKDAIGGLIGNNGVLQSMVTDSWEAGTQNWTENMMTEFSRRRGYSMLPWMPVLTGHIVKSSAESDDFLWDFRKTLGELVAEYHYGQLADILHRRGMKLYSEAHESGRTFIADGMDVKSKADVPMGAMWTVYPEPILSDIRESASVAHLYGQNLVAAESFTAFGNAWAYSPERLKPVADLELANGLNKFVIHSSIHQPTDDHIPGISLGPYGQWFNRNETWAEQAREWTGYLTRSSYILQQGKFVADVIYYYGEDNNITALFNNKLPDIPEGYDFDFVNSHALLNLLSVKGNQVITPGGMSYKVLALDSNSRFMTLKVLTKIRELVKEGAIIVGPKPITTPSLADDNTAFNAIANELWNVENGVKIIGKGKVFTGKSIREVLDIMEIQPDVKYTKPHANSKLLYVHRALPDGEVYWINNRNDKAEELEVSFRVAGKFVEIWHPETGKTEQASYSFSGGRTKVPLRLAPNDAVFVVFRGNTAKTARIIPQPVERCLATLDGKWNLNFQKDRGAPAEISIDTLTSWTDYKDAGIKYFSGTGIYTKSINAGIDWFKKGARLWIDLGEVNNLAEVMVNGKSIGVVWKKPFRVEVTEALKAGENHLDIKVTNLWVNRLIGDQQPGIEKKYTYTTWKAYDADSPLLPSGLIGPVRVLSIE